MLILSTLQIFSLYTAGKFEQKDQKGSNLQSQSMHPANISHSLTHSSYLRDKYGRWLLYR